MSKELLNQIENEFKKIQPVMKMLHRAAKDFSIEYDNMSPELQAKLRDAQNNALTAIVNWQTATEASNTLRILLNKEKEKIKHKEHGPYVHLTNWVGGHAGWVESRQTPHGQIRSDPDEDIRHSFTTDPHAVRCRKCSPFRWDGEKWTKEKGRPIPHFKSYMQGTDGPYARKTDKTIGLFDAYDWDLVNAYLEGKAQDIIDEWKKRYPKGREIYWSSPLNEAAGIKIVKYQNW